MKTSLFFPVLVASCVTGAGIFTLAQAATTGVRRTTVAAEDTLVDTQWKPAPGQRSAPRVERFELRDDGSGPRLFRNGQPWNPGRSAQSPRRDPRQDPGNDFRRMLEEQLRRQFGGQPDEGGDAEKSDPGESGGLDMEKFMERLMRGMGPGGPQQDGDAPSRYSKNHRSALAEWRPAVARAREATVRVLTGNNQVALATIVSPDGYALTKASEVKEKDGKLECEFNDGRIVSAKVVDQLEAYDLALLKLDATGLPTVTFSSETPPVGTLVAAVNTDEDPRSTGVISVPARSLNDRQKGFLGIMMDNNRSPDKGVAILSVVDGGAAKRAGIQDGDVILSINGQEINYPAQLQKLITSLTPDEEVSVKFLRGDEEKEVKLSLGSRDEAGFTRGLDTTARMGSSLSEKSSGFPNAVQSDLGIDAEDCGGPVVDVNGAVVGLNIARAERVSTYMVPGSALASVLRDVREGKFTLARDPATLKGELREYERAMKQAEEALKAAQERRNSAREALEKLQQEK